MTATADPDEVLRSTTGKANFQRIARLLVSGGTTLLREIFDVYCPPSNLPTILKNPATKKQLKSAKLTKPQWNCLYPSPGVYGESKDFDVTLLFRLLRTICNLSPPTTGWDALPTNTDHCLVADLARIKYYRNSVYGHGKMEIADEFEFLSLWQEISGALVRIAGQISLVKKHEWQDAIDKFLKEPLTAEDERNVEELLSWYKSDIDVKKSLDELKVITKEGMDQLKGVMDQLKEHLTRQSTTGSSPQVGASEVMELSAFEEATWNGRIVCESEDGVNAVYQKYEQLKALQDELGD
ncbi:E3 ubiquitin-protein ligase DZIP3-like [Montipora foliosa]|uniref:E3 ubiquitin-protein ligase DZIP3-like n=1 Tax=Montipora foliosa TaxID=591990 RepID=UPI0035F12D71